MASEIDAAVGGAGGNCSPPKRICVEEERGSIAPFSRAYTIASMGGGGGGDTTAAAAEVIGANPGKSILVLGSGYAKEEYLRQIQKYLMDATKTGSNVDEALAKLPKLFDALWIDGTDTFVIQPEHKADYEVVFKPLCPHQDRSVFDSENIKLLIGKYRYKATIEEASFVVQTGVPIKMLFSTDSSQESEVRRAYHALRGVPKKVIVVENGADGICPIVPKQKVGRDVITIALLLRHVMNDPSMIVKLCVCGPGVDAHAPLKDVLERISRFSSILESSGHQGFVRIPPSEITLGLSEGVDGDGRAETNVHSAVRLARPSAEDPESKLARMTALNLRSRIDAKKTAAFEAIEAIEEGHRKFLAGEDLHLLTDHPEGLTRSQIAQKIIEMYGSRYEIEINSTNAEAALMFFASDPEVSALFKTLY